VHPPRHYLIDDLPRNLERFEGEGLLYTAPHNLTTTAFTRVNNWHEVAEYFSSIRG
jgi:5'(3')-deoxyribonucleotidase